MHVQSEAKVHATGYVYRRNPYTHYIWKSTFDFKALVTEHAYTESKSANSSINDACSWRQRLQRQQSVRFSRNTIIRLRQRFQQTGGVADRRRPGRPRVTNPRTDRFITLTHLRRRFQTATSSARQYGISKQTVLRRLRQARQPIRPRRPYVGQVLTARHRAARLQWAQRHFRWGRQQWARVLFSNESRFNLSHHDGRIRVFRRRGERLLIIVSLRGTDLDVGVLWYGVAL